MFDTLKEKFKKKFKEKNPLFYYACLLISFCIMIQKLYFFSLLLYNNVGGM